MFSPILIAPGVGAALGMAMVLMPRFSILGSPIVIGGLTFAYGEGGSKRILAGIVFGVGMAIGAVNFMAWLFP